MYTNPKSYANIANLAEMDSSGIPIVVTHLGLIVDVFGDEEPGSYLGNLRAKLQPSSMDETLMNKVAADGRMAALERRLAMEQISLQYIRSDGSSFLYTIPECPR